MSPTRLGFPVVALLGLLASALLAGCTGGEQPRAVQACAPGVTPPGELLVIAGPTSQAPGGNLSVKVQAINSGDCGYPMVAQNMTISWVHEGNGTVQNTTTVWYGEPQPGFDVGGRQVAEPGKGLFLGDFPVPAPLVEGQYTIQAELVDLKWRGGSETVFVRSDRAT